MNKGTDLKKSLGLGKLDNVFISLVYKSNPKSFLIFYDSHRQNKVITKTYLSAYSKLRLNRDGRDLDYSPLINIEKFGGNTNGALFIIYDTAFATVGKQYSESVDEQPPIKTMYHGKFFEYVTLFDLMDKDNMSDLTKSYRKKRTAEMGSENRTAKLIDTVVNQADNSVTFQFLTEATTGYPKDHVYGEVNPKTLDITKNPSKTYELSIKILEFFDWLDTHPKGEPIAPKDIKEMLEVANAQVFSTSPAYQYQSMNYNCSELDASIYPTGIAPKYWNKPALHGSNALLSKALGGLLRQIKFFLNPMSSQLSRKLKDRGLL